MIVVLAEKPSVARDIAIVLGAGCSRFKEGCKFSIWGQVNGKNSLTLTFVGAESSL
jgi:hypothetical protein